jgi:carbon monoxide dehydrogenase subunit G
MTFEQHCIIPAPREELWKFLLDIPQMALCVPGAENVTANGDDRYSGRLRVKIGPIRLALEGVVVIQEREREQWRATARSEAKDRRVGGGASVSGEMRLVENGPSTTELILSGQVRFLGKLGEFGEPLIRKQADLIVAAFAQNVAERFAPTTGVAIQAPVIGAPPEHPVVSPQPPASRPQLPATTATVRRFPWFGTVAGFSLGVLALAAGAAVFRLPLIPHRLMHGSGGALRISPLRMLALAGMAWIGAEAEQVLRRGRMRHKGNEHASSTTPAGAAS